MTSSAVRVLAQRSLDDIADSIRSHWAATEDDRFAIGRDLLEARERFPSDPEFGKWLKESNFSFSTRWAHVLRIAAVNEPAVRARLGRQLPGKTNFQKAVHEVVHPEPEPDVSADEQSEGGPTAVLIDAPYWQEIQDVLQRLTALSTVSLDVLAAHVPAHRRAATARRIRKLGQVLGGVAYRLEVDQ